MVYGDKSRPEAGQLKVCPDCDASAPRCRICDRPMAASLAVEGVCRSCQRELPRCAACGRIVQRGFRLQDGSQRVFCHVCVDRWPACLACGAPVGAAGSQLADGRWRCPICSATAIDTAEAAQALYRQIGQLLSQRIDLELAVPTPLVPVDRTQLEATIAALGNGRHPTEAMPRGIYARRGSKRGLYVELGLPRIQMLQVIAHEIGHAWQAERDPLLEDPLLVEGFAEWVAYQALEACGEGTAMGQMLARQDIYGQGLRRMLSLMPEGQPVAPYWRNQ